MIALSETQVSRAPRFDAALVYDVLARGQAAHPELADRMARAAHLVQLGRIEAPAPSIWEVASEREPNRVYRITPDGCDCAAAAQASGDYCEHRLAVALLFACEQEQARYDRLN